MLYAMYIELVIFNNLAMDALLAVCTLAARRKRMCAWRIIAASILGGAIAAAYPLMGRGWQIAVKVLLSPLLTVIFAPIEGKHKLGDYIASFAVFMLFTFLAGGISYGVSIMAGTDVGGYATMGFVALAGAVIVVTAALLARRGRSGQCKRVPSIISAYGRSIDAVALCDSGNMLQDSVSGYPVIMLSDRLEDELKDVPLEGFIDVQTVGGESSLPLIRLDFVEVEGRRYAAYGAFTGKDLNGCDAILQCTMF